MHRVNYHYRLDHGLDIEDTIVAGDRLGVEHLYRYWLAWTIIKTYKPKLVWDMGCGSGYGARIMLEQTECAIVAIDADKRACNAVLGSYGSDMRLTTVQEDIDTVWHKSELEVGPQLAVMFETFEMLKNRELFLEQLTNVMPEDGRFLMSSAFHGRATCKTDATDAHIKYSASMLKRVLSRYFGEVATIVPSSGLTVETNAKIKALWKKPEPFEVGTGVVLCSNPIKRKD